MTKKFDIYQDELANILIKRARELRNVDWYLEVETQNAIDNVQIVLDEYKSKVEEYQREHPMK